MLGLSESRLADFTDVEYLAAVLRRVIASKLDHGLVLVDAHVEFLVACLVLLAVHGLWYLLSGVRISVK